MRRPFHAIFVLGALALSAQSGTLVTRDGQTLKGDLALADGQIVVTPRGGSPRLFAINEVARATFAEPAGAAIAYGKPHADKRADAPHNVFVEYFADLAMTDRRLARYEGGLSTYWSAKTLPDPTVPARCFVRYSTRVVAKASQDYALAIEGYGPLRVWVDGQLKIDRWTTAKRDINRGTATVTLTAGKPVQLRVEMGSGDTQFLNRLTWSSRGAPGAIPAESLLPPEDAPPAPVVRAAVPGDESHFRSPASIAFDARVDGQKPAQVDLVSADAVIATTTDAPYHFDWKSPPAGVYKIRARATAANGVSGYSEQIDVIVADAGENRSLPAPWGQQTLGGGGNAKEPRLPGSTTFADGAFTITKAGGQLSENDDSSQFVYQPIYGDFQLVVRLASLAPNDNHVGPLAGIMIRENMTARDRFAAVVVAPQSTVFVRRPNYWGNITSSERTERPQEWLKLERHASHLRAYTSADGKDWGLLATDKIDLPERMFVGLCAMSRAKETPAVATFDNVALRVGPPALTHGVEGVLFRSGTFLAAEINGMKEGTLTYTRAGKRTTIPNADVARLVYKAVPADLGEHVPADRTGVLLGSGDFIEGDLKEVSYRVTVSNIVFGHRTFAIKNGDVLAIYVKDAGAPGMPCVITATDGSVYQSKTITVIRDAVSLQDPTVGPLELPLKDLARLKMN
jgi:hypothetical protein